MWRKIANAIGLLVMCAAIVAYLCYASRLARNHRDQQRVEELHIIVDEGSAMHKFTTPEVVRQQLQQDGIEIEGKPVKELDVANIRQYIARNGYVEDVDLYVTYSGKAYIELEQRKPVMRLLAGGVNSYVTEDGMVFCAPYNASYYTAVVTGRYQPIFPPMYEGSVEEYYAGLLGEEDAKLEELAKEYASLKSSSRACEREKRELRDSRSRGFLESKEKHKMRVVGINREIDKRDDKIRSLRASMSRVERRQELVNIRKKKLQKSCDDFMNLINFVSQVSDDSFWNDEVVQFVADTTRMGDITLRLIPRSGDFLIEFGTLANGEVKLEKLGKFYESGFPNIGWDRYKKIDVRYDKQVICTK